MRAARLIAVVLVVASGAIALAPFRAPVTTESSGWCGPSVVASWHAKSPTTGWFGYAPLTERPIFVPGTCRVDAQHRMQIAIVLAVVALALLALPWIRSAAEGRAPRTS